jgi:hypothetical protein
VACGSRSGFFVEQVASVVGELEEDGRGADMRPNRRPFQRIVAHFLLFIIGQSFALDLTLM